MPESILEQLRDRCVDRASAKDDFRGVTILSRKKGDLLATMLSAMSKSGVVILVSVPSALPDNSQTERVILDPVDVIFEISENVPLNQLPTGTQKGAMYLAERIAANFKFWEPFPDDLENAGTVLMPAPPGIVELAAPKNMPVQNGIDPKTLYIVAVHFKTELIAPAATPD